MSRKSRKDIARDLEDARASLELVLRGVRGVGIRVVSLGNYQIDVDGGEIAHLDNSPVDKTRFGYFLRPDMLPIELGPKSPNFDVRRGQARKKIRMMSSYCKVYNRLIGEGYTLNYVDSFGPELLRAGR